MKVLGLDGDMFARVLQGSLGGEWESRACQIVDDLNMEKA